MKLMHEARQELIIRRATRADVAEIVRLLADDPLGRQRERYEQPLPPAYYDAFDAIDGDPGNELLVAEMHGDIIGTLQITYLRSLTYRGGKRAQIEAVRVDRRYRDEGIGGKLLAWAIDRARDEHCHMVQLTTNKERGDARRFYERFGFRASHGGMKLDLTQPVTNTT